MSLMLRAVAFDSPSPAAAGAFWAGLLGREVVDVPDGVLVPGDRSQVGLRFVAASTAGEASAATPARNRLHLHVTSDSVDEQRQGVETALRLGGRRRGRRPLPLGGILYLRDPDGNEFCMIEPGNSYLADAGRLGEVTIDGTLAAARFWRDALGWTVVWDEDEQLVIQSPAGGTKLAWDDWGDPTVVAHDRQRFDLVASDLEAECARLIALGASEVRSSETRAGEDAVVMRDPDGIPFTLARVSPYSADPPPRH